LRVVDEISKGLIVDQTIEKVSFCAPDRNHEKGFAYICRDGTTRRWMCHGFLALKESGRLVKGERLSHAVGCAFAICLEKKQKREKEAVQVQYNDKGTSFSRTGSFRQATLTERLCDPQSTILSAESVPLKAVENPHAVSRPHATDAMLQRQSSFRGFTKLNDQSPFKRQLSLRLSDLPSTLQRQSDMNPANGISNGLSASPIPEASPTKENPDSIAEMCQQLTQGLTALQADDPFANVPSVTQRSIASPTSTVSHTPSPPAAAVPHQHTVTVQGRSIPLPDPIRQNNPWGGASTSQHPERRPSGGSVSEAEAWLSSTAHVVGRPEPYAAAGNAPAYVANGNSMNQYNAGPGYTAAAYPVGQVPNVAQHRAPHLTHIRSHSIDTAQIWDQQQQRAPTLRQLAHTGYPIGQFTSQQNGAGGTWSPPPHHPHTQQQQGFDPFDAAWAAKKAGAPNPFNGQGDNVSKTFEVNL